MFNNEVCKLINKSVFYCSTKVGKKVSNLLYTVDLCYPVKIGNSKDGYMLRVWHNDILSSTCLTELDILRLLHGDEVITNNDYSTFRLVKR